MRSSAPTTGPLLCAKPEVNPWTHDWNQPEKEHRFPPAHLLDQTLRDGLQSPSVLHPSLDQKLDLLEHMVTVGVNAVDLGIVGSSARATDDAVAMLERLGKRGWSMEALCSARMTQRDVSAIVEVASRTGRSVWAYLFVGTSQVRAKSEAWSAEDVLERISTHITWASRAGLPVAFVAEDASRTSPSSLERVLSCALDAGAGQYTF